MASNSVLNSAIHANRDANLVNNTYHNYGPPGPDPMALLQERVAFSALHNSAERFDAPRCHPETRIAVLSLIDQWAKDRSEGAQPVFWLTGAAGAGKSAIAQTMVERWKKEGVVAFNFFFWRTSSERNHKTRLVPTLSYQLSEHYAPVKALIREKIGSGGVFRTNIESQVEELFLRPLETVPADQYPVVIVIDGLDECCVDLPPTKDFSGQDFKAQQGEILDAVAFACKKIPSIRFLVVSRPEQVIRTSFSKAPLQKMTRRLSLNEASNINEDIQLFFICGFEEIRLNYPSLPSGWPGEDRLSELVRRSSGQFIYASVVVKYITHRRQYPEKCLQDVLDLRTSSTDTNHHPLAALDELYTLILKSVSTESIHIVRLILGLLCHLSEYLYQSSLSNLHGTSDVAKRPYVLEELLFLSHGEVIAHLADLHSVLHIPPAEKPHETIRIVHATLPEYLQNQSRSKDMYIAPADIFNKLCQLILRHLTNGKRETCVPTAKMPREEIGMCYYLMGCELEGFKGVPHSKEMRNALWSFLNGEKGVDTSSAMNAKIDSKVVVSTYHGSPCGRAHYLDPRFKRNIVTYLLDSNTSAFQPSLWRRIWIGRRLRKARKAIDRGLDALQDEYRQKE